MADRSPDPSPVPAPYPPAPWAMVGSMWLTLFRLGRTTSPVAGPTHPPGLYGAAFVSYGEGSPLTYSELLAARLLRHPVQGRRVSITDIWVDSPASMAGGRELWAIPKGLCDFDLETRHTGPWARTSWSASRERRPIAAARFTDVSGAAPRLPFRATTWQPELPEGGGEKGATLRGTARSLPARAHWDLAADGPLAFLREARQLGSVRVSDFRMSFG